MTENILKYAIKFGHFHSKYRKVIKFVIAAPPVPQEGCKGFLPLHSSCFMSELKISSILLENTHNRENRFPNTKKSLNKILNDKFKRRIHR